MQVECARLPSRMHDGADEDGPVLNGHATSVRTTPRTKRAHSSSLEPASCSGVATSDDEVFRHPAELSRAGFKPYHLTEFKAEPSLNDDVERQVIQYASLVEQQHHHHGGCLDSVSVINFGKAGNCGLDKLQGRKFAVRTSHDTMPSAEHFQSGDFTTNPSVLSDGDPTRIIVARYLQDAALAARTGYDIATSRVRTPASY